MRYAVLVVLTITLGVLAAPPPNGNWAEKMFNKTSTTYDFGSVPRGALLRHQFQFTNIYAVPLQVVGFRASCSCAGVSVPQGPINPKESATIDVTMDTRRFTGPKTVMIYITVGPQFVSTATLQVSANCRADVVFNPGEINFGGVPRGETPTQIVDVEYAGALWNSWKVTGVVTNGAPVDVAVEKLYEPRGVPGGVGQVGYRLKVTLKPDAPSGALKQELVLETTDRDSAHVPLLIEGSIQASLSVVPGTVSLGAIPAAREEVRRVVVRGNKPFRILAIDGLGDGVDAEIPKSAAAVQIVTIKCKPTQPGELRRELLFKTDLEDKPVPVKIEGSITP